MNTIEDCPLRNYLEITLSNVQMFRQIDISPEDRFESFLKNIYEEEEEDDEEDDEEKDEFMFPTQSVMFHIEFSRDIGKRGLAAIVVNHMALCGHNLELEDVDHELYDDDAARYSEIAGVDLLPPMQHIFSWRNGETSDTLIFHNKRTALIVHYSNVRV